MQTKELTAKQVNQRYAGRYVDIDKRYDYETQEYRYTVRKAYSEIHENTTLGEDVGTAQEYSR